MSDSGSLMEQFLTLGSVLNHGGQEPGMSHLLQLHPAAAAVAAVVASSSNSPPMTRSASVSENGPESSYTINGAFTTGK